MGGGLEPGIKPAIPIYCINVTMCLVPCTAHSNTQHVCAAASSDSTSRPTHAPHQRATQERNRFGRFWFRFPDGGESTADVYDRVSIFVDGLVRDIRAVSGLTGLELRVPQQLGVPCWCV